jgi:PilZ domain
MLAWQASRSDDATRVLMSTSPSSDRRRYRRVHAPILMRPAGLLAWAALRTVNDISLGGIRTYADEPVPPGRRLEIELLFPESDTATVLAEVAWAEALGEGAPARHEMGLHLISASPEAIDLIKRALAVG